ncbi:hypothetical protein GDO78_021869 [Eleutherodactylus coqui]|uniref:Uncharacterized protein n=1 Tax=Eleutherodactylus coqui TaxID=57060 RepID=A0A8J6EGK6_ELECQ|nr:hypothetical protein GDO78_021869 [Eleutherodactylus coqui]
MTRLEYPERHQNWDYLPWKKRRLRGDQITMYKYMRGQYKDLSQDLFIPRTATVTRRHPLRLEESRFHHQHRKGFFTVRAVRLWNSLPEDVVIGKSMRSLGGG